MKPLRPAINQDISYVFKKNVKKWKSTSIFLWKTRVEAKKVMTSSFKTLDFVTPIDFVNFFDNNIVIFGL